jgi:Zn-dependent protease
MGLISLLFSDPSAFFVLAIVLLYSVILHEIAHGWVAGLFGDPTAKLSGRLSLSPVTHIDPIGALALLLVGFGWARPVPVNFYGLRPQRLGLVCVALAGCVTNILLAALAIMLYKLTALANNSTTSDVLFVMARINITLGAFNLIPIPPLDGSKILMGLLPGRAQEVMHRFEPYGFFVLIALLYTGVLNPVIIFIQQALLGIITAAVTMGR